MNRKGIISLFMSLVIFLGVFGGVVANAEGFTTLKTVSILEGEEYVEKDIKTLGEVGLKPVFQISFSNGVYRVFDENKEMVEIVNLEDNSKVEINLEPMEDKAEDIERTKALKLETKSELKEEGNYEILIKKEFKANNGKSLEKDIKIPFIVRKEIIIEETKEKTEEKLEDVKEEVGEKLEEVKDKVEEKVEEIKEEIKVPFKDIKDSKEKDHIKRMFKKGYIKGRANDIFAPKEKITRAEVVSLVSRVLELEEKAEGEYENLSERHWYKEDVLKAIKAGLIKEEEIAKMKEEYTLERINKLLADVVNYGKEEGKSLEDIKQWSKDLLEKTYGEELKIEEKMKLTRGEFTTLLDGLVKELDR